MQTYFAENINYKGFSPYGQRPVATLKPNAEGFYSKSYAQSISNNPYAYRDRKIHNLDQFKRWTSVNEIELKRSVDRSLENKNIKSLRTSTDNDTYSNNFDKLIRKENEKEKEKLIEIKNIKDSVIKINKNNSTKQTFTSTYKEDMSYNLNKLKMFKDKNPNLLLHSVSELYNSSKNRNYSRSKYDTEYSNCFGYSNDNPREKYFMNNDRYNSQFKKESKIINKNVNDTNERSLSNFPNLNRKTNWEIN